MGSSPVYSGTEVTVCEVFNLRRWQGAELSRVLWRAICASKRSFHVEQERIKRKAHSAQRKKEIEVRGLRVDGLDVDTQRMLRAVP